MADITALKPFEGRRSLDMSTCDGVSEMLAHGGTGLIKRKLLTSLAMDFEVVPLAENGKVFIIEKQYTTFVNKHVKLEVGMDNQFKSYVPYYDDAFGVDVGKACKYNASNGHMYSHATSTGKHLGYEWDEDRYIEGGDFHWITVLKYKGKETTHHRVFLQK
ncbi:hypothetical protein SARC_14571 [Sphaeroforma arctica JP610]|uniref:Uncharacterized protein n=1 Tax=Sphaeroforma arctica JP610 TaxID=667725 RepID=A0A0L0F819_9EUKA|nr:hypothetical protein SARC_14571 [Sphaeroforma arctica JP610]KNC72870.1 hypothetical protein SARC_14571 [Sphaeroforma arctica JP610]|eukprot:XP_014146772.1 hypothetical protein SARC_14571 [Sphaeroforma arctica JP610]